MRPTLVLLMAIVACSGKTDAGPIGEPIDMRQFLPESLLTVTTGMPDSAFRHEVKIGSDSARVEATWKSVRHGPGLYLTDVRARLLSAAPYDSLRIGPVSSLQNVGTKSAPVEAAAVRLSWFKKAAAEQKQGSISLEFDAAGRRLVRPTQP